MQFLKKDELKSPPKKTVILNLNLLHELVSASAPATFPCQRSCMTKTNFHCKNCLRHSASFTSSLHLPVSAFSFFCVYSLVPSVPLPDSFALP